MLSLGIFLYNFLKKYNIVDIKILTFLFAHFNSFLNKFQVHNNTKKKWGVRHLPCISAKNTLN